MSLTEQLRRGMVIRYQQHLYTIDEFHVAQTGKQKPTVKIKLRALKDGHQVERTLDQIGTLEEVASEIRDMQYIYASGTERVFMDLKTYEQYALDESVLAKAANYLVEQETYRIQSIEGQPVSLQMPPLAVMEVIDTAPPEHAGGGSSVYKEARIASGIQVMVPLFIKTGDKIKVSTENGEYQGKEH
ncbi:MAG: elongation factor P [Planctomycetota bacterium]